MSDSLPPDRGQVPSEARDLDDVVLSGDTARVPASRQPAAAAMAALRSAPAPSELSGEAAARAAYRLFVLPDSGWPVRAAADPLIAAEPAGRPHSHRRVSRRRWPGGRPAAALLGAAACVVAVVWALTSSGGSSGPPGQKAGDTHQAGPASVKQPVLEGGARAQTPAPAATAAASSRAASAPASAPAPAPAGPGDAPSPLTLCQEWLSSLGHPWHSADRAAERSVENQLSSRAGGMNQVLGYCIAQLSHSLRSAGPVGAEPPPGNDPGESWPFGQHAGLTGGQAGAPYPGQH